MSSDTLHNLHYKAHFKCIIPELLSFVTQLLMIGPSYGQLWLSKSVFYPPFCQWFFRGKREHLFWGEGCCTSAVHEGNFMNIQEIHELLSLQEYTCAYQKSPVHNTWLFWYHGTKLLNVIEGTRLLFLIQGCMISFPGNWDLADKQLLKISSEDIFLTSMYCSVFVSSNKICAICFTSCQKKSNLSGSKRDLTYLTCCHKIITSVQCFCPKATPQSLVGFWNMELGRRLM